jgi:hypothetical protein
MAMIEMWARDESFRGFVPIAGHRAVLLRKRRNFAQRASPRLNKRAQVGGTTSDGRLTLSSLTVDDGRIKKDVKFTRGKKESSGCPEIPRIQAIRNGKNRAGHGPAAKVVVPSALASVRLNSYLRVRDHGEICPAENWPKRARVWQTVMHGKPATKATASPTVSRRS